MVVDTFLFICLPVFFCFFFTSARILLSKGLNSPFLSGPPVLDKPRSKTNITIVGIGTKELKTD